MIKVIAIAENCTLVREERGILLLQRDGHVLTAGEVSEWWALRSHHSQILLSMLFLDTLINHHLTLRNRSFICCLIWSTLFMTSHIIFALLRSLKWWTFRLWLMHAGIMMLVYFHTWFPIFDVLWNNGLFLFLKFWYSYVLNILHNRFRIFYHRISSTLLPSIHFEYSWWRLVSPFKTSLSWINLWWVALHYKVRLSYMISLLLLI